MTSKRKTIFEYIYQRYSVIWKISSLITFLTIILNSIFIKNFFITVTICIIHLLIIIPTGIIAKKMDNQLREQFKERVLIEGEK